MKMIFEHSAGGVVFKKSSIIHHPSSIKWLICKHSGYHKWVLPKGIVEAGESSQTAALREVEEETGIKAKIIKKITPNVTYKYTKNGILVDKTVEFFLMEYVSGDIKDHSWEMEEVKWASDKEALNILGFDTEKQTLRAATELV